MLDATAEDAVEAAAANIVKVKVFNVTAVAAATAANAVEAHQHRHFVAIVQLINSFVHK